MADEDTMTVEVAYALVQRQCIISLQVAPKTNAIQAILASGILNKFPEIDLTKSKIGIFGKSIKPETPLREHDRVEIYRPLIANAKLIRKQRATLSRNNTKSQKLKHC